ncbi:MAG: hypothetical protein M1817_005480 [Caeruleum heppii]|nr:MAG: hypothetical protein M1817_005480 [Caeruleum heppii]
MASALFRSIKHSLRRPDLPRHVNPQSSPFLPSQTIRAFASKPPLQATYSQVVRGCRTAQKARKPVSPALVNRPEMKGVCLRVGITKPKKPNSAERKTARIRLSSGRVVTCYIPGEGVRYHLVRGAMDLGGVGNRVTSRSKYGTKKPKAQ